MLLAPEGCKALINLFIHILKRVLAKLFLTKNKKTINSFLFITNVKRVCLISYFNLLVSIKKTLIVL